jgi:hypothetical protein
MFQDSLTKLRRFLRDPDGDIWSDDDLLAHWNDALIEIAQKTHILEKVLCLRWPPEYDWVVTFDWEKVFVEGDILNFGELWQVRNVMVTFPWEAGYYLDSLDAGGEGYVIMHPWELAHTNAGHTVYFNLHNQAYRIKLMSYDRDIVEPRLQQEIAIEDRWYKTVVGRPRYYWQRDEYTNQVALYPRPSATDLQETDYTELLGEPGMITNLGWLDYADIGIKFDIVDNENALLCIFEPIPRAAIFDSDNEFPPWMIKYVEYATLERAYSADTDGFIPSLRDYWTYRKEVGIQAIKKYKTARLKDRNFCLNPGRRAQKSTPKLPYGYNDPY